MYFMMKGQVSGANLYFSTCGVTFLTIGDSFVWILFGSVERTNRKSVWSNAFSRFWQENDYWDLELHCFLLAGLFALPLYDGKRRFLLVGNSLFHVMLIDFKWSGLDSFHECSRKLHNTEWQLRGHPVLLCAPFGLELLLASLTIPHFLPSSQLTSVFVPIFWLV